MNVCFLLLAQGESVRPRQWELASSLSLAVTLLTYEGDGGIQNSNFVINTPWALWVQSTMDRFGLGAS